MVKAAGLLTAEERARITDIQDLLIGLFVEHREAVEKKWARKRHGYQDIESRGAKAMAGGVAFGFHRASPAR